MRWRFSSLPDGISGSISSSAGKNLTQAKPDSSVDCPYLRAVGNVFANFGHLRMNSACALVWGNRGQLNERSL